MARDFMDIVGDKKRFLKENELGANQQVTPEAGTYNFYTKSSLIAVDASGGFVYAYSKY